MLGIVRYFYSLLLIVNFLSKGTSLDLETSEDISPNAGHLGELNNPCQPDPSQDPDPLRVKWAPYKDEKCLTVLPDVVTFEEAKTLCQNQSANLISIDFNDKQAFLDKFFKSYDITNFVWIGLKYKTEGIYEWLDGTKFAYSNWGLGYPKKNASLCVQMQTQEVSGIGKWSEMACNTKNGVVCEKDQKLSISHLQKVVINRRKNPVPVGFTYVQLPKEKSPTEVWPWMTWTDVSSSYAGVFFRVVGGNASFFGKIQEQSSRDIIIEAYPRISRVSSQAISKADGKESSKVSTGHGNGGLISSGLTFQQSSEEVRPLNMAIKIWRRTE